MMMMEKIWKLALARTLESWCYPPDSRRISAHNRYQNAASVLGMHISWRKTKVQNLGTGQPLSDVHVSVDTHHVECVDNCTYLGSVQSSDGYCRPDIRDVYKLQFFNIYNGNISEVVHSRRNQRHKSHDYYGIGNTNGNSWMVHWIAQYQWPWYRRYQDKKPLDSNPLDPYGHNTTRTETLWT